MTRSSWYLFFLYIKWADPVEHWCSCFRRMGVLYHYLPWKQHEEGGDCGTGNCCTILFCRAHHQQQRRLQVCDTMKWLQYELPCTFAVANHFPFQECKQTCVSCFITRQGFPGKVAGVTSLLQTQFIDWVQQFNDLVMYCFRISRLESETIVPLPTHCKAKWMCKLLTLMHILWQNKKYMYSSTCTQHILLKYGDRLSIV